jgi:hypothetical protein
LQLELGLFIAGRNAALIMKTKLLPIPKAAAKTLSAEERNALTARLAALIDENNRLLRELASARTERDALGRALNALERKSKERAGHEAG